MSIMSNFFYKKIHINMNLIYDLTPFTPSEALHASTRIYRRYTHLHALHASTVSRAAADPGILIFFQPG